MAKNIVAGANGADSQSSIAIRAAVHPIGTPFRAPYRGAALTGFLAGLEVMRKLDLLPSAQIIDFHSRKRHVQAEKK